MGITMPSLADFIWTDPQACCTYLALVFRVQARISRMFLSPRMFEKQKPPRGSCLGTEYMQRSFMYNKSWMKSLLFATVLWNAQSSQLRFRARLTIPTNFEKLHSISEMLHYCHIECIELFKCHPNGSQHGFVHFLATGIINTFSSLLQS